MAFPSTALLMYLWLSSAVAYKLPLLNEVLLTDDDNTIDNPNNSPFRINYKWEWQSQDRMNEGTLMLARLRRDIYKKFNKDIKTDGKILPKVKPTESPLDELSDSTPYILKASTAAFTKVKSMHLFNEDETSPKTGPDQITKEAVQKLEETTPLTDLKQTTKVAGQELDEEKTTHVGKSVTQLKTLVTEIALNDITISVLTSNKATTIDQVHSTNSQNISIQQTSTNDKLLEDITSSSSQKPPETSPPVILHDLTTGLDVTTVRFSASSGSSAKPAAVTHITTASEEKIYTQSMMRQCMIIILILAVVCTVFIISTIALAAKLSTMKQKSKLRHPATYTEMRCISSLLPDSDQQNKSQHKRLKTFAANMEDSDGDNTTLNSFLPDH